MAKDENQCEYVGDYGSSSCLSTEKCLFVSNLSENQTESPEKCINMYDLVNSTEPSDYELPPKRRLLKDLTSKLSNLKKILSINTMLVFLNRIIQKKWIE